MLSLNVIKGQTSTERANYYTKEYAAESVAAAYQKHAEEQGKDSSIASAVEAVAAARNRTRWWGYGAKQLGLEGPVDKDDLQALLEGRNPNTGQVVLDPTFQQLGGLWRRLGFDREPDIEDIQELRKGIDPMSGWPVPELVQRYLDKVFDGEKGRKNSVSAIDLTFSASKSVSLMVATGDTELRAAATNAHDKAVEAALNFVAAELACVRRGKAGEIQQSANDLTAALVSQMSSRDNDPQLHTHAVLAAIGRGHDGRMTALNAAVLHKASKVVGSVYQAELRHQLTSSLGVSWDVRTNGLGEVHGVPLETLRRFSKRGMKIDDTIETQKRLDAELVRDVELRKDVYEYSLDKMKDTPDLMTMEDYERVKKLGEYHRLLGQGYGQDSFHPKRSKLITQLTRQQKSELPEEILREDWTARWNREGHQWNSLIARSQAQRLVETSVEATEEDKIEEFRRNIEKGLTEKNSSFSKKEAYIEGFRVADPSWNAERIRWEVNGFLDNEGVIVQKDTAKYANWALGKGALYTTHNVLAQERKMEEIADRMLDRDDVAVCSLATAANKSAEYTLNDEQEGLLAALTVSGQQLVIARGIAGSGKTHVLGSAASVLRTEGYQVVGLATAAATAQRLSSESGFDRASSIDRFLMLADNGRWVRGVSQDLLSRREELMDEKRELLAHYGFLEEKTKDPKSLAVLMDEKSERLKAWDDKWQTWEKEVLNEQIYREAKGEELQTRGDALKLEEGELRALQMQAEVMESPEKEAVEKEIRKRRAALQPVKEQFKLELQNYRENLSPTEKLPSNDKVVIVIDESGMVETSHYARLLELAEDRDWKIAFVGDDRQLQEVNRGGAFRMLSRKGGAIELREAMRAKNKWEQEAQKAWWSSETREEIGEVADAYLDHGRVSFIDKRYVHTEIASEHVDPDKVDDATRAAARNILKEKMLHHYERGESSVLMASKRADVFALNTSVQEALMSKGEIQADGKSVRAADIRDDGIAEGWYDIHVGDRVALLKNIPSTPMMNGMNGLVKGIKSDGSLIMELPTGPEGKMREHTLKGDYLDQGVVSLGYAMTAHKAQGVSVDYGYVLGDSSMNREQLYPSMTRGKKSNDVVWIVDEKLGDGREQFADCMTKSVSKKTAMEHYVSDVQYEDLVKQFEKANREGKEFEWDEAKAIVEEEKRQEYLRAVRAKQVRDKGITAAHTELRDSKVEAQEAKQAARERQYAQVQERTR